MKTADVLPRMYEDLANHFARQGESRQRDQCLVLAAALAIGNGLPEDGERLRRRLLLTNPHHLLRPYASMTQAMQSGDVRDLVDDLRKQWPAETVAKLLNQPPPPLSMPEHDARAFQALAPKKAGVASAKAEEAPSLAGAWLTLTLFGVGLALAGGILFVALGTPIFQ